MKDEPEIVKELRSKEKNGMLNFSNILSYKNIDNEKTNSEEIKNESDQIKVRIDGNNIDDYTNIYRIIAESTTDLIAIVSFGFDPKYIYVNPVHEKILGYTKEEMIGKSFFGFIDKNDKKKLMPILKKYLAMKVKGFFNLKVKDLSESFTFKIRDKSGNWHDFETTANIYKNQIISISRDITENKKTSKIIEENEKRLKNILENLQSGVIIIDEKSHEIIDVNKFAAEMIGLPKEKILGNICHKFICPAEKGKCPITDLKQKVDKSEKKMINKNKKAIDILKTVNPVKINNRDVLIESFVDISEIKKTRLIVEKSKKHTEDILNAAADGIRIVGNDFKIIDMNKTMEDLIGINKKEAIGKSCKELFYSESSKCGTKNCSLVRVLKTGKGFQEEEKRKTRDGRIIDFLTCVSPYKDENGNIIGIIEDYRDITEVKKVEEELSEKEKRFKQFFKNSPVYCYMVSPDGKIIDINLTAMNNLDIKNKSDVIGRQIIPTVYSDVGHANKLVKKWLNKGFLRNEEIKIKSSNGERFVLLSVDNVNGKNGNLLFSFLMQIDITDINRAQEELKEKVRQLEKYKKVTIGRELKMINLKKEINEVNKKFSIKVKNEYKIVKK